MEKVGGHRDHVGIAKRGDVGHPCTEIFSGSKSKLVALAQADQLVEVPRLPTLNGCMPPSKSLAMTISN
jgi:hypothetical protein